MLAYIVRRLFHSVVVVLIISLAIFIAIRLTGDPVTVMFQSGEPTKEALEKLKQELGLDQPIHVQYWLFIKGLMTGNLGESFRSGQDVFSMVMERMGATFILAFCGLVAALLIAVPVGVISAVKRGSLMDVSGRLFSLLGISFPNFWLGIILILIFSVQLKWLPASGYTSYVHLVLPSVTLGLILSGILARLIRSSMLEVLNEQYIVTARSKGITEWTVIMWHALRNAMIPAVTFLGLQFGTLLGGAVIIEVVFSWPGVGRLMIDAINQRDFPVVQGSVMILAFITVMVNLLVDISYSYIDPRVKVGEGGNR